MADYPTTIFSQRTLENVPGVTFDDSKKTRIYAEDVIALGDEITAIENALGENLENVSLPAVVAIGMPGTTKTNSTTSDQDFAALFTIPANTLVSGRLYRVVLHYSANVGVSSATIQGYIKLGTTKVLTNTPIDLTNSLVRTGSVHFYILGTDVAGASKAVEVCPLSAVTPGQGVAFTNLNSIAQPVSGIATNTDLDIIWGLTWSGTGSTESITLLSYFVEQLT